MICGVRRFGGADRADVEIHNSGGSIVVQYRAAAPDRRRA